jgi:ATP-binding cassette subfamily F protein uup
MNLLSAENLSQSVGDRWLFKNISLGLSQGDKVALIGTNGTGKTTLLTFLSGKEQPDSGIVSVRKGTRIGYLEQSPSFDGELTVMDVIFAEDNEVAKTVKAYEKALLAGDSEQLTETLDAMDKHQAWDFESRAKEVLGRLGIQDTDARFGKLSGGQKKRVALARILLEEPDLLILDEPTNHLDLATIEWLEVYLNTANTTFITVTHDRYFLDKVCNTTVELEGGNLYVYKGNYGYFLEKKAEREGIESAEIDKARNLMRKELEWIRRQPKARGTKAKYRVDAFEDLKDKASQRKYDDKIDLNVRSTRLGSKIIELQSVGKRFGEKELIHNFLYTFRKGDRIGIVGPNGTGKTTLLQMITGNLRPDNGQVVTGDTVNFGYYTQSDLEFKEGQRVSDIVKDQAEVIRLGTGQTVTASQYMQAFLFPPNKQHDYIENLSGGEKRRLQLLLMLMREPNFLILDEPTNDLDISSLNVLEEFLLNFSGCLLIVSHDRYFLDRLVDHLFVFEGDGKIRDFPGNYTDYRNSLEEDSKTVEEAKPNKAVVAEKVQPTVESPKKKASFKEKREFETLEVEIGNLELQKSELLAHLEKGGEHDQLLEWSKKLEQVSEEMSAKELRWLELSEIM